MDATTDKDPMVHEQIFSALCYLGGQEPEEILNACEEYLRQHDKLAYPHRIIILRAMEAVVRSSLAQLDKSTAKIVIFLASNEMTKSKDVIFEWQQAASNVLVAVGRRFINKVMEEVLTKFQPGVLPHYFIVQTFANLSVANEPALSTKVFVEGLGSNFLYLFLPYPHYHSFSLLCSVFGMVPFLNSILGTMLPMLAMAKQDNMKSVFCYGKGIANRHGIVSVALQYFSESIQEYLANLDKAPDPTVRRDTFSSEIFSAYEVLFNSWLQSREAKVGLSFRKGAGGPWRLRLAVVEALGPMSHLMPSEKLEEQLPRLIPGILALYRKPAEAYYVSKSLCQILEASVNIGSRTLDTQLDTLLNALQLQICAPLDSSMPVPLKNHNEVLRCFTVLASSFPDRLLGFLLPKLESGNERTRVGTLAILRQIINSASSQMEIKKPFILSSMKLPLQDNSNKPVLCPVLLASLLRPLPQVLWPYLLAFVTPIHLTNALTPLCKSLIFLAAQRQEEEGADFQLSYDNNGLYLAMAGGLGLLGGAGSPVQTFISANRQALMSSLPSPYALTARLLVAASQPYLGDGRGVASLRLLNILNLSIHKALKPLWSKKIPTLVEHLEENTNASLFQKEWEEQLLKETLAAISDTSWTSQLILEMCRQLNSYNGSPLEKNFLYKCIGTALATCANKDLVRKQLQELLETARAGRQPSGLQCTVLALHLPQRLLVAFPCPQDRSDHEVEKVKSTLILCYGYVARHAPGELVLARIDTEILRNVFLYFNTKVDLSFSLLPLCSGNKGRNQAYYIAHPLLTKAVRITLSLNCPLCPSFSCSAKRDHCPQDLTLKLCLIRSICMICQAICASAQSGDFTFSRKAELVSQMMDFIKAEPLDSLRTPIRQRAMMACMYLVVLEPPLSDADKAELIETCLGSVLPLPLPDAPREKEVPGLGSRTCFRGSPGPLMRPLFHLQHLSPWVKSAKEHERERAVEVGAAILEFYREKLNVSTVVPFYNLGLLMALFSPRCTDSLASVRQHAVDCIYSLLYVQLCYEGRILASCFLLSCSLSQTLRCPCFSSAMAKHAGPKLSPIVKNLSPMLNSLYDSQRVTTTAFFAEVSEGSSGG
ncbi:hypothetical protein JD844_015380 [Phrynosoma platyrhinos]|uniref:Maestro heat-like repeat-containing protein family member 1 n=1 Tax=Phrynosoma platyrhinos TaxID=52577 RepID=A0ABQ7SJ34_PHRPL|nr:hypothetical protein JD844_015380 [Phrynosoma platyrhinos]